MMKSLALAGSAVLLSATVTFAQPLHLQPASQLVFPRFDAQPASATVLNVTNTNTNTTVCAGNDNFQQGDVQLHYVYVGALEAALPSAAWQEFDRFEQLTPGDTISVLTNDHNPEGEIGYVTVRALSPDTAQPIDFDYLIGSAYIANSDLDIMSCYTPYAFRGYGDSGYSTCGHELIPGGDSYFTGGANGYDEFPDELFVDSFFEEKGIFSNRLTLMSTSGPDYNNVINVLIYNNQEDVFSRNFQFVCWTQMSLSDISATAGILNGDENEFQVETGWVWIDGDEVRDLAGNPLNNGFFTYGPAILGVFEQTVNANFTAGHALHYSGTQSTVLAN